MDDAVAQFVSITNSSPTVAEQFLNLSDGRLDQAVQLYLDSGGLEEDPQDSSAQLGPASHSPLPPSGPLLQRPGDTTHGRADRQGVIHIDSEEDPDDDVSMGMGATGHGRDAASATRAGQHAGQAHPSVRTNTVLGTEDDEAIARRMQEELYAGADDTDGVRAPLARTRETLVGPGPEWGRNDDDDDDVDEDVDDDNATPRVPGGYDAAGERRRLEMLARHQNTRPGIFNQRPMSASVWDDPSVGAEHRRRMLARATAGQSEESSKASMLAEMYRPPVELMSRLSWDDARDRGKATEKWLLVNVQDPSIFDCQVLNRDIWKDAEIRETVRENFLFIQYNRDDPRGVPYVQFYFRDSGSPDAYPHIAIVDPRTGEQVKVWSGPPVPKPMDFLMQLHEFLDRYSLKPGAKNPIPARRAPTGIDLERMTEEQMLEMAMQNSLASQAPPSQPPLQAAASEPRQGVSPSPEPDEHVRRSAIRKGKMVDRGGDATTTTATTAVAAAAADRAETQAEARFGEPNGNVQRTPAAAAAAPPTTTAAAPASASPFAAISAAHPHEEPPADPATTTRIQFRHAGGRIIRRFLLTDPVRRLYEWLKATPIDGKAGVEFELVSAGQNLLEKLDASIQDAGLRNQTVMIEFYEDQ